VLFGVDRVLAARMGLTFSAVGTVGMGALGYWGDAGEARISAHSSRPHSAALVPLVRAQRHVAALAHRRREIEDQLVGRGLGSSSAPNHTSFE
jgi:hypothetical protein